MLAGVVAIPAGSWLLGAHGLGAYLVIWVATVILAGAVISVVLAVSLAGPVAATVLVSVVCAADLLVAGWLAVRRSRELVPVG